MAFGDKGAVRKGSYRAYVPRNWKVTQDEVIAARTFDEAVAKAVQNQLNKRLGALTSLGESISASIAMGERGVGNVQNTPRVSNQPSFKGTFTREEPPTRLVGKGRSTSIGDVYKPSREYQPYADPSRRMGSLASAGKVGSKGAATLLSNFGDNKEMGEGWLGASASRIRGMQHVMSHPVTFMERFAWVYVAKHVTDAVKEWRGWNDISWTDTTNQANAHLDRIGQTRVGPGAAIGGALLGAAGGVLTLTSDIGALLGASLGGGTEGDAARASSLLTEAVHWLRSGRGPSSSPWAAQEKAIGMASFEADHQRRELTFQARNQAMERIEVNLQRSRDKLAQRGVGGIYAFKKIVTSSPAFQEHVKREAGAHTMKVDEQEIFKKLYDKYRQEGTGDRSFAWDG